jgi:adenylate kinase family enzyme
MGHAADRSSARTAEVDALLGDLSHDSHVIVTGQIGCGKTALAKRMSARFDLTHLHIDEFNDDEDPLHSAARAADAIEGGWVAEANVWQIPQAIWESADLAIYLDYANSVHYRRILRRCLHSCIAEPTWTNIRDNVTSEWLHFTIIVRYADENRAGWQKQGGITSAEIPVFSFSSPRETEELFAE